MPDHKAVVVTNTAGQVLMWDCGAERMFGRPRADAQGRPLLDLIATPEPKGGAGLSAIVRHLEEGRRHEAKRVVVRNAGDHRITAAIEAEPVTDVDGTVLNWAWTFVDVARRARMRQAARNFAALVEGLGDAVISVDVAGTVTSWPDSAQQLFGYSAEEMVGRPWSIVVPPDGHDRFLAMFERVTAGETIRGVDAERVRCDGTRVDVRFTALPVFDADGKVAGATAVMRDVSETQHAMRALCWQAQHDPLTRLPNRTALLGRLDASLRGTATGDLPPALLLLDLDGFRDVNSAHGHATGDTLLATVADRLTRMLPPGHFLARTSGDEFAVVVDGITADEAKVLAGTLVGTVRTPVSFGASSFTMTATIGIAAVAVANGEELLRLAGAALADAQRRGRAKIAVYEPGATRETRLRMELASDLADALATDQLRMHYQPVIDVMTQRLLGVEALARWDHAIHGPILPEQFVRVAAEASLSVPLDGWALRRACLDAATLRDRGVLPGDGGVSVNLCLETVLSGEADALVAAALADAGLAPGMLVVELPEVGLADASAVLPELDRLRRLGVGIAVDAFGAGGSTLADLRRFAVGALKIDRAFIARMGEDAGGTSVVASVIEVARGLGVTAIAMGVETPAQATTLARLGCQAAQGFLYGGPVPLGQLSAQVPLWAASWEGVGKGVPAPRRGPERGEVTADHGLLRVLQLATAGASATSIASALNREGFRTPKGQRWHANGVERVLGKVASA
jgi:diguanylate cyclase (GGDEF)-like protein/PAS domain S-box-containing protein